MSVNNDRIREALAMGPRHKPTRAGLDERIAAELEAGRTQFVLNKTEMLITMEALGILKSKDGAPSDS